MLREKTMVDMHREIAVRAEEVKKDYLRKELDLSTNLGKGVID